MKSISAVHLGCAILMSIVSAGCLNASTHGEPGRELAQQYQCGTCHVIPGVDAAKGTIAVTLEGFGRRAYIAGHVPNSDENLTRWIVDPAALVPGTLMPNMGVTTADARAIAAYLMQLR
jgi:cytochrome c1